MMVFRVQTTLNLQQCGLVQTKCMPKKKNEINIKSNSVKCVVGKLSSGTMASQCKVSLAQVHFVTVPMQHLKINKE